MKPQVLVIMGVSGSGKSTIAELLSAHLGWPFQEGDDLHPQANRDKMHAGVPLDDADRAPWLALVAGWIDARLAAGEHGIITCSALKRAYRDIIIGAREAVLLVYLHADREELRAHTEARHHEFMPPSLLDSQLATLEPPQADERVITAEVIGSPDGVAASVLERLRAQH